MNYAKTYYNYSDGNSSMFRLFCLRMQFHNGEQWTNVIDGYDSADVLNIFLSKGDEYPVDLRALFAEYDIHISKITAHSSDNDIFVCKTKPLKQSVAVKLNST